MAARLLSDRSWLDSVYFPTNIDRLATAFSTVKAKLARLAVPVLEAKAGLFCWADFRWSRGQLSLSAATWTPRTHPGR